MSLTTRFAPSPTGYLHIGGVRNALYSWLHARRHGGRFVLRIEDTDRERSTPEAVQAIRDGMAWLGLESDAEPVFQSQRNERYREIIEQLLADGHAYRCYCTREELDAMRAEQRAAKQKPRYDGRCRDRSEPRDGVEPVIRFRNPDDGAVIVEDLIKGSVRFENRELDDLIIARSDGSPTYNLCVVVDDMDMGITHVIRGDDHVNNTPRQINILKALGAEPPVYAHVPMILGPDGVKLSKRHGAVSVMEYRALGYMPDALLNYLVRLGWAHGDQELFTRAEMIELFDVSRVQLAPARFDVEKLNWVMHQYLKAEDPSVVAEELRWHLEQRGIDTTNGPLLVPVIEAQRERCKTLVEMTDKSIFFYVDGISSYDEKDARKHFKPQAAEVLDDVRARLDALAQEDWKPESIHAAVHGVAEARELGLGKVAQPIRVAVVGMAISPPIDQTLYLLGRERTLDRLAAAVEFIRESAETET